MQKIKGFNVRKATHDDVFHILVLGYNFAKEAPAMHRTYDPQKMESSVRQAIDLDSQEIFLLENDGIIIGMLACVVTEYLFSNRRVTTDLAWFVDKDHRGGTKSIRLIKAYEDWARSVGAEYICMADITNMQELGVLYKRLGYSLVESSYAKEA
jgi:GNAT superfamily N-acetyltransferase|tara:strand:+ start:1372 stop:1833 length:462 start_codon:yes stop_codon:yes gene_type:complete